jgi:hypothetical protein
MVVLIVVPMFLVAVAANLDNAIMIASNDNTYGPCAIGVWQPLHNILSTSNLPWMHYQAGGGSSRIGLMLFQAIRLFCPYTTKGFRYLTSYP